MLKKTVFIFCFLILFSSLNLFAQNNYLGGMNTDNNTNTNANAVVEEVYTGTIIVHDKNFIFHRCTPEAYSYYLVPPDWYGEVRFEQEMLPYVTTADKNTTVEIKGKYQVIEGVRYIVFESVERHVENISCHIFGEPEMPYNLKTQ